MSAAKPQPIADELATVRRKIEHRRQTIREAQAELFALERVEAALRELQREAFRGDDQ